MGKSLLTFKVMEDFFVTTRKIDKDTIDGIIDNMITTVTDSKEQVFEIVQDTRTEYERLKVELEEVKVSVIEKIQNTSKLELLVKAARNRLMEVDSNFNKYSEEDVKDTYEIAQQLQNQLLISMREEKALIVRRNELERRLQSLLEQLRRADLLVARISVILNFLHEDFQQVSQMLEDAKQKQAFGFKLIQAQEEERLKLSHEIHDGPAQMLANIMMRSDFLIKTYRQRSEEESIKELSDMKEHVRTALTEVRRIIYDLRPMALDDLGLVPTLKKYLKTVEEYKHNSIRFDYIGKEHRLDSKMEIALFRLVQEAVQNACKHSNASLIQVKIEFCGKKVNLLVKDNGIGFDVETSPKENSFGLIGMKERVELLNGCFELHSRMNEGTSVKIAIEVESHD
jgi:two-component system sensor histidine kinase DegS